MKNQFLSTNAVALTVGTLFLTAIYIVLLVTVSNKLILKKQADGYDSSDRIIISSIIFSFLLNLSVVVEPVYQFLHQFKYSLYNQDFTQQILTKTSLFILISTLYSAIGLVLVALVTRIIRLKPENDIDGEANISYGLFYGLLLVGITLLFKQHLEVLLRSMIQYDSVPIFN